MILIKRAQDLIHSFIFNNNNILRLPEIKGNLQTKCLIKKSIEILTFYIIYSFLKFKSLKTDRIVSIIKIFFITRVYGRSLLLIKLYFLTLREFVDIIHRVRWSDKWWFAWPLIFIYEFNNSLNDFLFSYLQSTVYEGKELRIIIKNRKIWTNPSKITERIIENNTKIINNALKYIISNKNYNILQSYKQDHGLFLKNKSNNFVEVFLKGKIHLCYKIVKLDNLHYLLKSYSSKKFISIINQPGQPIINNYYEDSIEIQEQQQNYSYFITAHSSTIKNLSNFKILNYYTMSNPNYVVFFDLQERFKFCQALKDRKFLIIEHDEKGVPINKISYSGIEDRLTKPTEEFKNTSECIDFGFKKIINEVLIKEKWILEQEGVTDLNIIEEELYNYLANSIITMPTIIFQEILADVLASTTTFSYDDYTDTLGLIKSFCKH